MTAHVHAAPPPVRNLASTAPEGLAAIVQRTLAKNPADRFATPAEVVESLAPWSARCGLAGTPARAPASPPLSPGEGSLSLPSPSGRGAGGEGPLPAFRGWKRFVAQLLLLLMVGGLGFALGITIRIKKDGQTTTVEVPDGSSTRISAEGQVDVNLPWPNQRGQRQRRAEAIGAEP